MKKIVFIVLATALVTALLTGCGHNHIWAEASCSAPKTCTNCGETEGELLSHSWTDATCANPKTCTVCKTQEGDALEHKLTNANYQTSAVCSVCGASVGEPTPAIFAEKGLALMSEGVEYDYNSITHDNASIALLGKVSVSDYRVVPSDDTHEARDGYEWQIASLNYTFISEDVSRYGYNFSAKAMDYYLGIATKNADNKTIINFNGVEYERNTQYAELQNDKKGNEAHVILEVAVQVPVDYDGVVLCAYNPANKDSVDTFDGVLSAEPLFFRMK